MSANKENSKSKRNAKRGFRIEVEEPSVNTKQGRKRKSKVSFSEEDVEVAESVVKEEVDDEENESDSQENEYIAAEYIKAEEICKLEAEQNEVVPNWPQSDLKELIRRIEEALPKVDNLSFSTRVDHLKWDSICFNNYTSEECKSTWMYIQKRVRRFRLLGEMLQDAKQWISKPWTSFYGGIKTNKHPDMPKKPLSLFLRFFLDQKNKVYRDNPGMEVTKVTGVIAQMYKSMSPTKRDKFLQEIAEERKEYVEKLEEFYNRHPEVPRPGGRVVEKTKTRAIADPGPKKPQTPFNLYFDEQLKGISTTGMHRDEFKLQCKENWRAMPDKGKIVWINKALDMEVRFHEELKDYKNNNPNYNAGTRKAIISKDENLIRERMAGKPSKPPSSAYSLFTSEVLRGDEIKKVDARQRMKEVSVQWKDCSETRKEHYRQEVIRLTEEYKLNFSNYLETLPEDQRQEELKKQLAKRKAPVSSRKSDENAPARKKKKKLAVAVENVPKIKIPASPSRVDSNKYAAEPLQPPVSAFALFSQKYSGKKSLKEAWNNLEKKEKANLEEAVEEMKRIYLKEYVKFLKSLSRDDLKEYQIFKNERDAADNNDDSDVESDSDNESSDINDDDDDF